MSAVFGGESKTFSTNFILETIKDSWDNKILQIRFVKPGAIIIPGISGKLSIMSVFILQSVLHLDSHAHILEYGATRQLPLEEARSIQGKNGLYISVAFEADSYVHPDAVARVREYILSTPEIYNDTSRVITGGGWDHTVWPSTGWPSAVRVIFPVTGLFYLLLSTRVTLMRTALLVDDMSSCKAKIAMPFGYPLR